MCLRDKEHKSKWKSKRANLKSIQKGGQVVDNEKPVLRVKCYRVAF